MRIITPLIVLALAGTAAADEYYYTIMGPDGPVFRHVMENPVAGCVEATVTGGDRRGALPMTVRFQGAAADSEQARRMWPITVCEATMTYEQAYGTTRVTIPPDSQSQAERAFPLPKRSPQRIGIIGDTGCKVKMESGTYVGQNCKQLWPLQRIANRLVQQDVDLVLHVGDFIYRKARCPDGREAECGGSPYGTQWATLREEILKPTVALQAKAPWVVPRGNHENCETKKERQAQGGIGAFILVDPRPKDKVIIDESLDAYLEMLAALTGKLLGDDLPASACREKTDPYIVPVDDSLELWVLDSNEPEDDRKHAKLYKNGLINLFRDDFRWFSSNSRRAQRILVTHRPLYGFYPGKRKHLLKEDGSGEFDLDKVQTAGLMEQNVALQEAFELAKASNGMPNVFDLAITGHNHLLQWLAVTDLPPNLTVGNSGTALDTHFEDNDRLKTIQIDDRTYNVGLGLDDKGTGKNAVGFTVSKKYGYAILSKTLGATKWTLIRVYDDTGADLAQCSSASGPWSCQKAEQ